MLDVSSPGRAEPKTKSIDVGANLLGSWIRNKSRLRDQSSKLLIGTVLVAFVATLLLPLVHQIDATAKANRVAAESQLKQLDGMLKAEQARQDTLKPKVAMAQMMVSTQSETSNFLGQITFLLNSATPNMAFNGLRAEVTGGQITMRCDANATSQLDQRAFFDAAGKAPNASSPSLPTTRSNNSWGKDGVSFEFTEKIEVPQ